VSDRTQYGGRYFCVKQTDGPDILVMADETEVTPAGALVLRRDTGQINLAVAPGTWTHLYAASLMDGSAVAVEHWEGEVQREE
jgi:hypothetical protein